MRVKITLVHSGSKTRRNYGIVAADSSTPSSGRFIQKIGTYNPLLPRDNNQRVEVDRKRLEYWLARGARPTVRVSRLLESAGIDPPSLFEILDSPADPTGFEAVIHLENNDLEAADRLAKKLVSFLGYSVQDQGVDQGFELIEFEEDDDDELFAEAATIEEDDWDAELDEFEEGDEYEITAEAATIEEDDWDAELDEADEEKKYNDGLSKAIADD